MQQLPTHMSRLKGQMAQNVITCERVECRSRALKQGFASGSASVRIDVAHRALGFL